MSCDFPNDRYVPHRGGGMNRKVGECLVELCHQGWRPLAENLLGRYARWKGSPRTLKSWLTQTADVGRTP